jgi:hypothetical protein
MSFAPQHDWNYYDNVVESHETNRVSNLSPFERFQIYEDYFETLYKSKQGLVDREAMERLRWQEKQALRDKLVAAYQALDKVSRGKNASTDTR